LFDAVELLTPNHSDFANAQARVIGRGLERVGIGISDRHQRGQTGAFRTDFSIPVYNEKDLADAIRKGLCTPTAWPGSKGQSDPL